MLSVKQGEIKKHFFLVFGMTRPGIKPLSPGPLANTLLIRPGLETFNLIDLYWIELLEIELFDNLTMLIDKIQDQIGPGSNSNEKVHHIL